MQSNMLSQTDSRAYFIEKYGEAYLSQTSSLEQLLTKIETGKDKFVVFGMEAGLGKSTEVDRIIAKHLNEFGEYDSKFLIVKPFVEDLEKSVSNINSQCNIPHAAIGVHSGNWDQFKDNPSQFQFYSVVEITHSRYLRLCLKPEMRKHFTQGRDTLIIDEMPDLPISNFSDYNFNDIANLLPRAIRQKLDKVCDNLFNTLEEWERKNPNDQLVKVKPTIDFGMIKDLEKDIQANMSYIKGEKAQNKVSEFLKDLYTLGENSCIYNSKKISTINKNLGFWTLGNNIILDANAEFDSRYKYAPNMTVDSQPKLIDRSNTTLQWINFNSSKTNIRRTENYHEEIIKKVIENHMPSNKTLLLTDTENQTKFVELLKERGANSIGIGNDYNGEEYAITHFGAVNGKNHWRDFDQVWILSTLNYSMDTYVHHYTFFAKARLLNHSLKMHGKKGKYYFINEKFEAIRLSCLAGQMYQGAARINRLGTLTAKIFIVVSDKDIVDIVASQFKNVTITDPIELENIIYTKKKGDTKQKETKGMLLARKLKELAKGTYEKSYLWKLMSWNNDGNFSKVLRDKAILGLEDANHIRIYNKTIEVLV